MPPTHDAPTAARRGCTITKEDVDFIATSVAEVSSPITALDHLVWPLEPGTILEWYRKHLRSSHLTSLYLSQMKDSFGFFEQESARRPGKSSRLVGQKLYGASFSQCIMDEFSPTGKDGPSMMDTFPSTSTLAYQRIPFSTGLRGNLTHLDPSWYVRTSSRLSALLSLGTKGVPSWEQSCLTSMRQRLESTIESMCGLTPTGRARKDARVFAKSCYFSHRYA